MSLPQAARYYQSAYGLPEERGGDPCRRKRACSRASTGSRPRSSPGAAGLLESLARRGVRMCIATATDRPLVETALERVGIRSRFECIFTCSESGGKDAPHIYEAALRRLGTPREQTWVFEDALYAVRTARAARLSGRRRVRPGHERDTAQVARLSNLYVKNLAELEAYFH